MKYAFIKGHRTEYPITTLCRALEVSTSGYYDWLDRPESNRDKENRQLVSKIVLSHQASHEIYGSPRIHKDLIDMGEQVGLNRVARLMSCNGIQ